MTRYVNQPQCSPYRAKDGTHHQPVKYSDKRFKDIRPWSLMRSINLLLSFCQTAKVQYLAVIKNMRIYNSEIRKRSHGCANVTDVRLHEHSDTHIGMSRHESMIKMPTKIRYQDIRSEHLMLSCRLAYLVKSFSFNTMRTRLGTRLKTSKTDTNNPSRLMTAFLIASISSSVWGIISIIPEARLNVDGGLSGSGKVRQSIPFGWVHEVIGKNVMIHIFPMHT